MKATIGLDIGGTKILGVLYGESGEELAREKKKTKASEGADGVIKQIEKVLDALLSVEDIELKGIGAGIPGIVSAKGEVKFSPNLPLQNFDLRKKLMEKYGVPSAVGNDVNVAMYGEYKHLQRPDLKNVLGLFVGTGVGGAIIVNGDLYVGQGGAGEFGHLVVQSDGAFCGCGGRGCLEAYASKKAIQNFILAQVKRGRETLLKSDVSDFGAVLKSSAIADAYERGDTVTIEAVDRAVDALGVAMGSLINLFNPQSIILGGGVMAAMGRQLEPKLYERTALNSMPGLMETVKISFSELGDDAGVYGAYQLIEHELEAM
jgi:glucokinase